MHKCHLFNYIQAIVHLVDGTEYSVKRSNALYHGILLYIQNRQDSMEMYKTGAV